MTGVQTCALPILAAGTYDVTVTDANNCSAVASVTVEEPDAIDLSNTVVTDIACNGGATGAIDLVVNGGTPGFTYQWSNQATTEDLTGLAAGT